ncbi:MAG TPA: hypothetical protein VE078_04205 [Thermoanaerobaculia bacterium]|nr:hypothetical protein [Thermoanaerobaculia bacterium]
MKPSAHYCLLATFVLVSAFPASATEVRDILGAAHAAGKYNFSEDQDFLNEGADRLLELGTRVIKVWLQPDAERVYPFNSDWEPPTTDVVELAQRTYYRQLFDKPFTTFFLVVPPVTVSSQFLDGMTAEESDAERDMAYRLAKLLLQRYTGSGKTFVIQNWEGDHLLRTGLAQGADPDPVRVQGMRDWWNARQEGVDQARREVKVRRVVVAHAAEVNLLSESIAGKVTATNAVVPFTHADLYSYSSWDLRFDRRRLTEALEYLKAMAPDSELYGENNIYLGEYGAVKDQVGPGVSLRNLIQGLTDAALGWGVRYAVFWQLFCNEATHVYKGRPRISDLRGFWLIRPDGSLAPSWRDFERRMTLSREMAQLRIFTGQFVGAEDGGDDAVVADRWRPDPFTLFAIHDLDGKPLRNGDAITLQAHNGLYWSADDGGGGPVYARGIEAGADEIFRVWKLDDGGRTRRGDKIQRSDDIALQAPSGQYLVSEPGSLEITATRWTIGTFETFQLLLLPD